MESYPYAGGGMENQDRRDMNGPALFKAPLNQTPCYERLPVIEMLRKDKEIGVFDAEKYFSAKEEKKLGANECRTQRQNFKDNKVLFPDDVYYSSDGISSPETEPLEGFTLAASSSPEACWNSQFGLSPNAGFRAQGSVSKYPANDLKKRSGKRAIDGFRCIFPCLNEKSVDINERRAPSVSNSLNSRSIFKSGTERFGGNQRYNVATPGRCYPLKRRGILESHEDDISVKSGYAASCEMALPNSFRFQRMEEPLWPAARNSHHESSEGLLDWNMAAEDLMENGKSGNLFSDFEEVKMMERRHLHGSDLSGLRGFHQRGPVHTSPPAT